MPPAKVRRVLTAALASAAMLLTALIAPPSASATTWAQMTLAQKESSLGNAMYVLLNQERALYHLPALTGAPNLVKSAYGHNLDMARYNLMTHQCPGEASPGTRIWNAGYHWTGWGENVGWTTDISYTGILNMEKLMFNEKAPDDGHRLNILGKFRNDGISVYIDNVHHKLWYTQDFGTY